MVHGDDAYVKSYQEYFWKVARDNVTDAEDFIFKTPLSVKAVPFKAPKKQPPGKRSNPSEPSGVARKLKFDPPNSWEDLCGV